MSIKNNIYSLAAGLGMPAWLRRGKGSAVTVLSLHRVSPERDFFFDPIAPAAFEQLVRYCARHYSIITFSEYALPAPKPKLILSFDDGYHDFIEYALPVLHKFKVKSNHNLVNECLSTGKTIWTQRINDLFYYLKTKNITDSLLSDTFGAKKEAESWLAYRAKAMRVLFKTDTQARLSLIDALEERNPSAKESYRMMTWKDAEEAVAGGTETGSHTFSHVSLQAVSAEAELEREIGQSVNELREKLKTPVDIIAFPNGQYNDSVVDYCRRQGLQFLLLVDDRINAAAETGSGFNLVHRINMINEPPAAMKLRAELFHSKIKKIRG